MLAALHHKMDTLSMDSRGQLMDQQGGALMPHQGGLAPVLNHLAVLEENVIRARANWLF